MGVYRYLRLRLADLLTAGRLVILTLPAGIAGALLSHRIPADYLRLGYGVAMLGLAAELLRGGSGRRPDRPCPCLVCESECSDQSCPGEEQRVVTAADGETYSYCARGLGIQRAISGFGGLVAGLISTGVGEATLPLLVRRSRFPVPVAAATSTLVVAGTVAGAASTHLVQLAASGGLAAIPWNLIVWAVPGAFLGAVIGTQLQGKVSERKTRLFFSALFFAIGIAFLLAFTVFRRRFG